MGDVTLTVAGYEASRIEERVAELMAESAEKRFAAVLDQTVRKRVQEMVDSLAGSIIEDAVRSALAEGWQKTNTYGEPQGPKLDIKARIGEFLMHRGDGYGNIKGTHVDRAIEKAVNEALTGEFKPVLAKAAADLKAQVDGVIAAKLADTMRSALGLK